MKYFSWLILIGILIFISSSCQNDREIAFKELTQAEYTRQADLSGISRWLNHPEGDIRLKAVQVLGALQDTLYRAALANRLSDDDQQVRQAAAFALGQLFSPTAANALSDALNTEREKAVRLTLLEALGKSETSSRPGWLMDYIESGDTDLQRAASLAAGIMAYRGYFPTSAVPFLAMRLNMPTTAPEDMWPHAYALYRVGALASFNDLTTALQRENLPANAKVILLKGLGQLGELIESDRFQENRNKEGFREIYQNYRSRDYRELIGRHLQDADGYVRVAALQVAAQMKDAPLQNEILQLLEDPYLNVRIEAVRSLATQNRWLARREARRLYREGDDWRLRGDALKFLLLTGRGVFVAADLLGAGGIAAAAVDRGQLGLEPRADRIGGLGGITLLRIALPVVLCLRGDGQSGRTEAHRTGNDPAGKRGHRENWHDRGGPPASGLRTLPHFAAFSRRASKSKRHAQLYDSSVVMIPAWFRFGQSLADIRSQVFAHRQSRGGHDEATGTIPTPPALTRGKRARFVSAFIAFQRRGPVPGRGRPTSPGRRGRTDRIPRAS